MTPQILQTTSHILIFIGVLLGGIGAFGSYYYGELIEKLPILSVQVEKPNSPRWSDSIFMNYTLSNQGKGAITVTSSYIDVISFKEIKRLREIQSGAPQVPIKAEVSLDSKIDMYKIEYINNDKEFTRIFLKETDADYIDLKINATDGIDYVVNLVVNYKYNADNKVMIFRSKDINLIFQLVILIKPWNNYEAFVPYTYYVFLRCSYVRTKKNKFNY